MIEIFEDQAGEFRFRVKGGNGEIVITSEGYSREADAKRGVRTLQNLLAEDPPMRVIYRSEIDAVIRTGPQDAPAATND